jgi:hypothetical protein
MQLRRYQEINCCRTQLELTALAVLTESPNFSILQGLPEIGLINTSSILGQGGDLRSFNHHPQFRNTVGLT